HSVPVVFRGAGTSLSGNSIPMEGGVVIDTTAMDRILHFQEQDRIVLVEPGLICDDLNEWLKPRGLFFAPDPGSSSVCTIGGMVANNSGGIQAAKYGVTKNHVLWMEIVLPDGQILNVGSKALKTSSSLSISDLIVGSEGCLAFIGKIALKLTPIAPDRHTYLLIFSNLDDAFEFTALLNKTRITPNMLELMDDQTTNAILNYIDSSKFPFRDKTLVLLEIDGEKELVEKHQKELLALISSFEKENVHVIWIEAKDIEQRDEIINLRKVALPALASLNKTVIIEDCSVLLEDLPAVVKRIKESKRNLNLEDFYLAVFGHVGDGNIHPTFIFNGQEHVHVEALIQLMDDLYNEIIPSVNGSITGEHGIGILKAPYLLNEHDLSFSLMKEIKGVFDPKGILNPMKGKSGFLPSSFRELIEMYFPHDKNKNYDLLSIFNYSNNCMKCGFCRAGCPSLKYHGWESWSPRARLNLLQGLVLGEITFSKQLAERFYACMLCDQCHHACPAGIQTASIFERVRDAFLAGHGDDLNI
ncbi:MAG: FAD-linked oxidase C-terminal domain-containing protein, partial [Promethearchaeota archaeon]